MRKKDYKVALVVPVYNEEETVETFVKTVFEKLEAEKEHLEIVFIDDGSKDHTVSIIEKLQQEHSCISLIKLSRNFGKEAAMSAAIDLVTADAIVPIDVDLQDPPELVLDFIKIWRDEGVDNVYAKNWSCPGVKDPAQYGEILSKDMSWTIDEEHMSWTNDGCFMHCLPVRRGLIVTDDVIESKNSLVIPWQPTCERHSRKRCRDRKTTPLCR